jgi:ATP-dependent DNA ligase
MSWIEILLKRTRLWEEDHACKLGLEGIVSKRQDSRYCSGRSPHWIKSENPACAAVKREAEEDWRR